MKQLIVNADDFGLTTGVNRAIIELVKCHSLTSATLMANADKASEAVSMALQNPTFNVGCHIVLVDGYPILTPQELPTLADRFSGKFRPSLAAFARDLFLQRIDSREIEAEAAAQIGRLLDLGVAVSHVDTHKHTHMFPAVLAPILRAAKRLKIKAIRNPFEPSWSLAATHNAPLLRRAEVTVLKRFRPAFVRLVSESGLLTTDGAVGVLATGTLDSDGLVSLLRLLPDGVWELVTHPAFIDQDLANAGTRLVSSREVERLALSAIAFEPQIKRIRFSDLAIR